MADKTEDQIQREKEAVAKMVGAKAAMETAIQRIATLESYGSRLTALARELGRFIGSEAAIRTHYHDAKSMGHYHNDPSYATAENILRQINTIKSEIIEKA